MCQISSTTPILTYLVDGNTVADDLLHFVNKGVESGNISSGDFLIMDNCRVHNAVAIQKRLMEMMEEVGFRIVFLPAYSPELNPIEFIFGIVKNKIRNLLHDGLVFTDVVAQCFATVTPKIVENCYYNSILKKRTK